MSRAVEIMEAVATLVQENLKATFSREEVRGRLGVDLMAWTSEYDAAFHSLRSDQPDGSTKAPAELRGMFRQVERGKYALTDAGRRLFAPPAPEVVEAPTEPVVETRSTNATMASAEGDAERLAPPMVPDRRPLLHATVRPRRLRRTATLRRMVRETSLSGDNFIAPLFIVEGRGVVQPISSMPGHAQRSVDELDSAVDELVEHGIPAVLLFGIPERKDAQGSGAWDPSGPVPRAIRAIKRSAPHLVAIADVCLCEYTDHGHCGVLSSETESAEVLNDPTLELLARTAVAYADAGADVVAPSAMMDGQVAAIRAGLDGAGYHQVAILAYAAKFASCFYAPFREAAESTPRFGDRRAYQMDPPNGREALREVALDVAEGADMLMVKPAGPYLDVIREVRSRYDLPLVAYQVSGEYAMIKAAAQNGWLDERRAVLETLYGIRRAGADLVITYYAKDAVRWLAEAAAGMSFKPTKADAKGR